MKTAHCNVASNRHQDQSKYLALVEYPQQGTSVIFVLMKQGRLEGGVPAYISNGFIMWIFNHQIWLTGPLWQQISSCGDT